MREEIPKIKEMMKELARISDKFTSQGTKEEIKDIVFRLKDLIELCDF